MTPIERAVQALIADLHRQADTSGCTTQDNGSLAQVDGSFQVEPLVRAVLAVAEAPPAAAPQIPFYDIHLRDDEEYRSESAARLQYQNDFAQSALKTLVLVNGGALIALFTFIGSEKAKFEPGWLWWSFAAFATALLCSMTAYFFAYFSQAEFMNVAYARTVNARSRMAGMEPTAIEDEHTKRGNRYLIGGVATALLGVLGFAVGSGFALASVLSS